MPTLRATQNIYDVHQDRQGILWIASQEGLFRYDGVKTEKHTISANTTEFNLVVLGVQEDAEGYLWVGTEKGLKVLDPTRSYLLPSAALGITDSLQHTSSNVTYGPGNSLYILVGRHVFQRADTRLMTLKWSLSINYQRSVMLYNRADSCLYFWDDAVPGNLFVVIEADGTMVTRPPFLSSPGRVLTDDFQSKWMRYCQSEDGVVQLINARLVFYDKSSRSLIQKDEHNQEQFAASFAQINHFIERKPGIFKEERLSYKDRRIYQLSNGIQAFVNRGGIFLVSGQKYNFFTVKASAGQRIRAIQSDRYGHLIYSIHDHLVWQSPADTLHHLLVRGWLTWSLLAANTDKTRFLSIKNNQDKCWLFLRATPEGVFGEQTSLDTGFIKFQQYSLCMAQDTLRGGIWHYLVNEEFSQMLFNDARDNRDYVFNNRFNFSELRSMVVGRDIWLGGSGGLKKFLNPDPRMGYLQEDTNIPLVIKNLPVMCLYGSADSILWIGTDGKGLFRYNTQTGQYQQFTPDDGLPDSSVFSILGESEDTVLWLGTGKGLSRFDVHQPWFENYFREDGLPSNEFNTSAVYRAPDGTIFMGGQNGIVYFNPNDFRTATKPSRQMAKVSLVDETAADGVRQLFVTNGAVLRIEPSVSLVKMAFYTDDYLHAEQMQYRYRIPGLINAWQQLTYADQAIFSYLPPGEHTLEVQVRTYRGVWLPSVFYTLEILPPWYATWWFRMFAVGLIAAGLYGLYWLRIRRLHQAFELRQQISHDLHDSLGARIYLLQALSHQIVNPMVPEAEKQTKLHQFDGVSKETFQSIRDFIWVFDPKQDELTQLFERMEDFAENYVAPLINDLTIDYPEGLGPIKIGPKIKNHALHIYQELLTNMLKHTRCETIAIAFEMVGKTFVIRIENRHAGIKAVAAEGTNTHSLGQDSLKYRLKVIEGQLDWNESAHAQQVYLRVPL